jgi:hypothetical protein
MFLFKPKHQCKAGWYYRIVRCQQGRLHWWSPTSSMTRGHVITPAMAAAAAWRSMTVPNMQWLEAPYHAEHCVWGSSLAIAVRPPHATLHRGRLSNAAGAECWTHTHASSCCMLAKHTNTTSPSKSVLIPTMQVAGCIRLEPIRPRATNALSHG